MLCTICGQRMRSMNWAYVWRTLTPIIKGMPRQWAKMPMHHECKELAESNIMSAKIAISAGHSVYEFSLTEPKETDERAKDSSGLRIEIRRV